MMYQMQIPALTTLKSTDATAIRSIVMSLVEEIYMLRKEIDSLKEEVKIQSSRKAYGYGLRR